jgi:hypothetical protein
MNGEATLKNLRQRVRFPRLNVFPYILAHKQLTGTFKYLNIYILASRVKCIKNIRGKSLERLKLRMMGVCCLSE